MKKIRFLLILGVLCASCGKEAADSGALIKGRTMINFNTSRPLFGNTLSF